jgi:filamin
MLARTPGLIPGPAKTTLVGSTSPFIVPVRDEVDPTKVVLAGPGIKPGVRANIPTHFTIDASRAGVAVLEVSLVGPDNRPVQVQVDETSQQIFSATYTATHAGVHNVNVKYAEKQIPCCPIKFKIDPQYDASKVKCSGVGVSQTQAVPASFPVEFTIDATQAGEGVLTAQTQRCLSRYRV